MPDTYVQRYVEAGDLRALVPETGHYSLEVCTITRKYGKANRARECFLSVGWTWSILTAIRITTVLPTDAQCRHLTSA